MHVFTLHLEFFNPRLQSLCGVVKYYLFSRCTCHQVLGWQLCARRFFYFAIYCVFKLWNVVFLFAR